MGTKIPWMLLKAMKTNMLLPVMHEFKICGSIKLLFYLKLFLNSTVVIWSDIPLKLYSFNSVACFSIARSHLLLDALKITLQLCSQGRSLHSQGSIFGLCSATYLLVGQYPALQATMGTGLDVSLDYTHRLCEQLGDCQELAGLHLRKL